MVHKTDPQLDRLLALARKHLEAAASLVTCARGTVHLVGSRLAPAGRP
jgi:hypothetical protein